MYPRGTRLVVRTNRGLEHGEVLTEATDRVIDQMDSPTFGNVMRRLKDEDLEKLDEITSNKPSLVETFQRHVADLGLDMKLIDLEQLLGGERIVIYYLSPERVDFRELVKVLASDFQTRIEMRQIGVRDEAKLMADYGDCGKPVCCNTHLSAMPPVSMRMAKVQKATLDPNKISGRCGRLKCCLRYEFDTYEELQKELPTPGSEIVTDKGKARVLNQNILAGQILIETEEKRRMIIEANEVLAVTKRAKPRK